MSLLAAGIVAGAKAIGGAIGSGVAKKKRKKAEQAATAQLEKDKAELGGVYEDRIRAEKDLGRTYEGMTSISPETQYARTQSERAASSAIEKAMRSGKSTGEIMNYVSALTQRSQDQTQKISAQEEGRRRQAMIAAKGQAVKAAQVGLAGKEAKLALEDRSLNRLRQTQQDINANVLGTTNFITDAIGDFGSAVMMNSLYGGGIDPVTGLMRPGEPITIGKNWGRKRKVPTAGATGGRTSFSPTAMAKEKTIF